MHRARGEQGRQIGTTAVPHALVDGAHGIADGAGRETEPLGDRPIRESEADQADDLHLTGCDEAGRVCCCCGPHLWHV